MSWRSHSVEQLTVGLVMGMGFEVVLSDFNVVCRAEDLLRRSQFEIEVKFGDDKVGVD